MRERRGRRHSLRTGGGQRRAAQRGETLLERRERREQQLDVVELQRHVLAVGHFALQRDAAPLQLRVERQADELDVLGILGEVAGGQRVLVRGDVAGLRRDVAAGQVGVRADGGVGLGLRQREIAARRGGARHAEAGGGGDGRPQAGRPAARALRCRAHGVQRAERIADARLRAGAAGDQRQTAVVVEEEQAELRAVVEARARST